ncbi:MAG TPA: glycoside hydrolase family 88 protein [Candidatus Binataceae bacterium]
MSPGEIRRCLTRLSAAASVELAHKKPHWGDAILCDGLIYAARALGDDAPLEAAARWFEPKLKGGPRSEGWFWFWAAEALPALDLYRRIGKIAYLDHARAVVSAFESKATRTPDGAVVPHPPALEVWVDVSYFTAPAMALLGRLDDDEHLIEQALDQMIVHHRNLSDGASGLTWHVAYVEKKSHSACLWARGNSWFSIAAAQVLMESVAAGVQARFAGKAATIREALARQLDAIVRLQDGSGLWHTVIDRADSYLEASATAGFALALGRAIRMNLAGLDSARAGDAYDRALAAISSKINGDGQFTGVSQQTPPGDFAFYQSVELGTAPFGTGVCMMALAEALGAGE